ncbi:unnamed protein product [Alternaria alternata]
MASKIVVVGGVNGQFKTVFQKLGALHAKNNFAFAIVAGDLFAGSLEAEGTDAADVQALVNGSIDVPLPTYFALDEVCHNLFFLGKRTTMKTSEGIRIVALGGQLDENIVAGQSKDKYLPFYTETDAKILRGATTADILITNEWPEGIRKRSKVEFNSEVQPSMRQCIADLRLTRFISLASFGNPNKQKWIYAFSLEPSASHPVSPPTGSTACPVTLSEKKRGAPEHREQHLVYDDGSRGRRGNKRRKGESRGPITASECFFCLANENIATHLVASIGENSYLTTAKGPLPASQTYPKLGFPSHMLIIPFSHQATLGSMEEEERHATYAEMQRYRRAMNSMLKSVADTDYGSVTWEASKSSLPHTHWQYLPRWLRIYTGRSSRKKMLEMDFEETSDFFRVLVWNPKDDPDKQTSYVMRFDEKIRFHNQFGREVLAKLLRLDNRVDWKNCGQTQAQEEQDVEKFKEAFKNFDFAA